MASRKRAHQAISPDDTIPQPPSLLNQIRSTWQFACLMQYIQLFGSVLKIDNELDVDMLEEECLKPASDRLAQLALTMLKWVSSHRGLTLDIFDEYTRRQYLAKAPHLNPFGEEEEPLRFSDMDIFGKLNVLHQLSIWTFHNPDRIRERMPEAADKDQISWRIEPFGEDKEGRHYILLDDNRLYRMTDPPVAKPTPKKAKAKPKPKKSGSRASKRQKMANGEVSEREDEAQDADKNTNLPDEQTGFGGAKWECLAVTLEEYRDIVERFRRSKNTGEKDMAEVLEEQAMPELLKAEESKARKEARRQKDLQGLEKMATAKRSSRLADKHEKYRQEEEVKAMELKRQQELDMAHKEHDRQMKQERDRESRMMTREQRIRDRDMRRILNEEELAKLQNRSQSADSSEAAARMSERNRTSMLEKRQRDLEKIKEEEQDDWDFDCEVCGVNGKNIDDGTHSIACDKCGVWQHSKCHKITAEQAERNDFKFNCSRCMKPKTNIKLKLTGHGSPTNAVANGANERAASAAQPAAQLPRPGQHSSSPPMGMFKVTPPAAARPPSAHRQGYGQSPQVTQTANGYLSGHGAAGSSQQTYQQQMHQPYSRYNAQPLYPPSSPSKPSTSAHARPPHQAQVLPPPNYSPQPRPQPSGYQTANGFPPSQSPVYTPRPPHQTVNGASFTSPAHHAPAPSLSATQGNTSLHFSPTAQPPPSSPNRLSAAANLANSPGAAHAYSPNTNFPHPGSMSPVKHASPSQPSSSFGSNGAASFGQALPPPASAFHSPTKVPMPAPQRTPGSAGQSMGLSFDGAPTLSPSVNANGSSNAIPVKKMTPTKSPIAGAFAMDGQDHVMTNGVENGVAGAGQNGES